MSERKLIGHVGVDSGQLILIDPCYVDSQWRSTGKINAVKFWGIGMDAVAEKLRKTFGMHVIVEKRVCLILLKPGWDPKTMVEHVEIVAKTMDEPVVCAPVEENTYSNVCGLTGSEQRAGALPYVMGHEGLLVAFSTGYGDGLYPVFATYNEEGRIARVTVEFMEDDRT